MLRLSLLQNLFKGLQEVLPKDRNVCKYVKGTVQTMQADVKTNMMIMMTLMMMVCIFICV